MGKNNNYFNDYFAVAVKTVYTLCRVVEFNITILFYVDYYIKQVDNNGLTVMNPVILMPIRLIANFFIEVC